MAALRRLLPIAVSFVVSAALLLRMIDLHAVNLLFSDGWDYLQYLMRGANLWQLMNVQHGPHRMGLGYLFIDAVYSLSGWSNRAEAFATAGLCFVTVAAALLLKRRLTGTLSWMDAVIPALLLTRTQYEIFIGTPNAAHGPIPLLLAVLAPLCWSLRGVARAAAFVALAFGAAFTGFAILLLPRLAALFLLDLFDSADRFAAIAGLAGLFAAIFLFLRGYVFLPAVACYQFPAAQPLQYIPFAGFILLRPFGIGHVIPGGLALASATFAVACAFCAFTAIPLVRGDRSLLARTAFLFSAFTLCFASNAAVGRVCLGLDGAFSTRYVPYALPLWLAVYFVASARIDVRAVGAAAVLVIAGQWSLSNQHAAMRWFSDGKSRWRTCYLARRDLHACNVETGFRVYPVENAPQVDEMFRFLEARHFNLFDGR